MPIGIQKVLRLGLTAGAVKLFLVEHQWDLMRIKFQTQGLEVFGVFAIEKIVPGIAAPGLLKIGVPRIRHWFGLVGQPFIRGTAQHVYIAEMIREHLFGAGQLVGRGPGLIAHEWHAIIVFLHVKLKRDACLAQITDANRALARLLGPTQGRKH